MLKIVIWHKNWRFYASYSTQNSIHRNFEQNVAYINHCFLTFPACIRIPKLFWPFSVQINYSILSDLKTIANSRLLTLNFIDFLEYYIIFFSDKGRTILETKYYSREGLFREFIILFDLIIPYASCSHKTEKWIESFVRRRRESLVGKTVV